MQVNFMRQEKKLFKGLKMEFFSFIMMKIRNEWSLKKKKKKKKNKKNNKKNPAKTDIDEFSKYITKKETDINNELFKNYFGFQKPSDIFKALNNINDTEKNNELVSMISSELKDLKEDIIKMSKQKRKIEKPDKIVEIVKEILKFNKKKNN